MLVMLQFNECVFIVNENHQNSVTEALPCRVEVVEAQDLQVNQQKYVIWNMTGKQMF